VTPTPLTSPAARPVVATRSALQARRGDDRRWLAGGIADLLTPPGRSPEEAEQLINYLAATDPAWRAEMETT